MENLSEARGAIGVACCQFEHGRTEYGPYRIQWGGVGWGGGPRFSPPNT